MAKDATDKSDSTTKTDVARKRTRDEEEAEQKKVSENKTNPKDNDIGKEPILEKSEVKDDDQHITKKSKVPESEENSSEDKTEEKVIKDTESKSSNDTSKHVFGSSSLKPKETVKEHQDEKPLSGSSTPKSGFVFGAKSAFTSKFKSSLNKPGENPWSSSTSSKADTPSHNESLAGENPWASSSGDKSSEKENGSTATTSDPKENKDSQDESSAGETPEKEAKSKASSTEEKKKDEPYAQITVPLEAKKVETGEEDEESIFSCRAKLYVMDLSATDKGWKERGIGNVHVNRPKTDKGVERIVMRADGVLKVIANLPLVRGLTATAGMKSSLASDKFVRVSVVENKKPLQYAFKMGNPETATKFHESVTKLIPEDEADIPSLTEPDKSSNDDAKKK